MQEKITPTGPEVLHAEPGNFITNQMMTLDDGRIVPSGTVLVDGANILQLEKGFYHFRVAQLPGGVHENCVAVGDEFVYKIVDSPVKLVK